MLETLMAIKNNNMTKIPQFDPSLVEHFRKLLKGMITNGKYVTTMNITMEDLLNGKFFLCSHSIMYQWYQENKQNNQVFHVILKKFVSHLFGSCILIF
jgi:hypothetical protein